MLIRLLQEKAGLGDVGQQQVCLFTEFAHFIHHMVVKNAVKHTLISHNRGTDSEDMQKRIEKFGLGDQFGYKPYPVRFWDLLGKQGHPIRTTISQMGPLLLSRLLNLNDTQSAGKGFSDSDSSEHG